LLLSKPSAVLWVENNFADASDIALWIDGFNVDAEPTTNSDSTCNPLTRMGQAEA
jgi:hypothetical protein